jgi:hypothetical protein
VLIPEGAAEVVVDASTRLCTDAQSKAMVEECAAFASDMSHSHDDHCDTLTMAISLWKHAGGVTRGVLQ